MGRSGAIRGPSAMSPLGAVVRGVLAGAVGTVALDAVNYAQYRAGGGTDAPLKWEFSAGLDSWDDAPAPAQVGKRLYEGLTRKELPPSAARLVNNVTHWSYGTSWGALFGILAASSSSVGGLRGRPGSVGGLRGRPGSAGLRARPGPRRPRGPLFGTMVWLSGYVVLPLAKLYKPIWQYDAKTLAKDWSGHLAYGTATSAAFSVLSGRRR